MKLYSDTCGSLLSPETDNSWKEFTDLIIGHILFFEEELPKPIFNKKGNIKIEKDAIDYFKKIVEHKIAVFEAGIELLKHYPSTTELATVFLDNLAIHDMSKFSWEEFDGYLNWDFKTWSGEVEGYEAAWVNHKRVNPHHPEYWFTVNRSGVSKVLAMPEVYVMEMVADWIGAGKTYGSGLDVWLPANLHTFVFHQDTAIILQKILNSLGFVTDHTDTGLKTI